MNVVLLTDFASFNGGASRVALLSARGLAIEGHTVTVLAGVGPVDPSLCDVPGLTVECLGQHDLLGHPNRLAAALQGIWNPEAGRRLRALLERFSPDNTVVHVHLWGKALSSSVVRTASVMGFPLVLTLHDFLAACPTGTLFQHPTEQICTLKPMSMRCVTSNCDARNYGHKLWRVGRQLAQIGPGRLPSGIDSFISISPTCRSVMEGLLPAGATMHTVSNPVDVEKQAPADVAGNLDFVFLGRLAREKGPVLFAEAATLAGVRGVWIGDGELRDAVTAAHPGAVITGWQSGAESQWLLRTARALVFPSLWRETQGLVVAEALALGVPCIVADGSAATDWIEDGVTGLLFRHGDAGDLARKIQRLRDNPDEAAQMGRTAYQRYWARPATLARHVAALEAVYSSIRKSPMVMA